jgi:tetratricopeptide (TPR) repeat protein
MRQVLATLSYFHSSPVPVAVLGIILGLDTLAQVLSVLQRASALRSEDITVHIELHPLARHLICSELNTISDPSQYLVNTLRHLKTVLPANSARSKSLTKIRAMRPHVTSVLDHSMTAHSSPVVFLEAAVLAKRHCAYLITEGDYALAADFVSRFQACWHDKLREDFGAATALRGKLATSQALLGESRDALHLFNRIYRSRKRHLGAESTITLHGLNNLALAYHDLGDHVSAARYHTEALESKTKQLDKHHPDTLLSVNNLGIVRHSQGHYATAQQLFDRSLTGWLQVYDPDDLFVLAARSNRGIALFSQGHLDDAEHDHRHVYRERRRILGRAHHETIKSKANLAMTINDKGRHVRAEELYREVMHGFQSVLGPTHPDTLKTYTNLATALHDQARYQDAEELICAGLPLLRARFGDEHNETLDAMEFRAILLHCLERYGAALSVAEEAYDVRLRKLGYDHDDTQRSLAHVRDLRENCEEERAMAEYPVFVSAVVVA